MKKSVVMLSAAFVLALGSAFTTKALNITGFYDNGSTQASGETNSASCQVTTLGTDCTIFVSGLGNVSPVFSDALGAQQQDDNKRIKIPN